MYCKVTYPAIVWRSWMSAVDSQFNTDTFPVTWMQQMSRTQITGLPYTKTGMQHLKSELDHLDKTACRKMWLTSAGRNSWMSAEVDRREITGVNQVESRSPR